jgi:hypothetical protein
MVSIEITSPAGSVGRGGAAVGAGLVRRLSRPVASTVPSRP